MADEDTFPSKIEELGIESIKAAGSKKKLKDVGLPITGSKSKLVESLQGSLLAAKKLESSGSELYSSSTESEDKDGARTCDEELSVSSEKSKEAPGALIPLKKRVVAQVSAGSNEKPKAKKIVLNRNHIPTPKFIPNKPEEPLGNKIVVTDEKSHININKDSEVEVKQAGTVKDGINKISLNTAKHMSETERIILRAKRFNITAPEPTSKSGKITITSQKAVEFNPKSTGSSILTSSTVPALDVLQKRALRFGEQVSKVLKQSSALDVLQKRALRFGENASKVLRQC